MVAFLLIVIVAVLLFGASAVLRFAQGFLIAAAVVAALIVAALFFEAVFPYLLGAVGVFGLVVAGVALADVSRRRRAKEASALDLDIEIARARARERAVPAGADADDNWPPC